MADDSMDVLPDQGRDAGNEDIDIDIDLTAAQADEDDILEDAEPDRDYGESLQNFQDNDGKDDPMADDDASSYIMDDADTRTDLRDSDQDRPKSPPYTDEQHQMGFEQKLQEEQTAIWQSKSNHTEVPQHGTGANTSQTSSVTKESHKPLETLMGPEKDSDSASALSGGYVPTETESRGSDAVENLRTTRSDFVADKTDVDDVANVESHSTLTHTSVTLADHSPPGRETGDTIAEQGAEYVELINQGYDRIIQKEELKALAQEHSPVEVCFNDRIYPLVRTSDSDDPDNFFFEDYGYAELALVDFFKGLRDVLRVYFDVDRDETDYEIHVIIKSLGVQMNETSLPADITFSQLINIHEMLRHNDGIDRISPMTISLFIKLRFPVRFRDLLTAAQEGKGMSEIVIEEDSYITGGTAGTHEDETYEAPATAQNADADFRVEESKIPTTQDRFSALEGSRSEVKVDGVSDEGSPSGLQRSEYSAIVGSQSAFVTTAQSSNTKTSVEQEEEDLIDYEDDEETEREAFVPALAQSAGPVQDDTYNGTTDDFITPCLKPSAKNEELRRRSLSIAAEDHSQEPALDEVVVVEHSNDADDGITYEGQAGDDNVYGSGELWEQDEYNENPETYLDEVPATHGAIEDTEEHSCDDAHIENLAEFDGDVAVQYHVSPSGEGDLSEQNEPSAINDFDALDYEHNHDEIHDESNALSSEEAQVSGVVDANFREFTEEVDHKQQSLTTKPQQLESAIAEAPLEEMRSRTSENLQGDGLVLLSPQNGRSIPKPLELQDEIDYEDEDDRISPQNNNTPTTQTTITSTNGSGKRMRSDEDLENVPSARSKEAKRARS